MSQFVPPQPDDTVAWITVRLHAHGHISVQGTIGDKKQALAILAHARDAITRQIAESGLVIPNRDVEVVLAAGLKELGDIPREQRGEP